MQYEHYEKFLINALQNYVKNGGSAYNVKSAITEYIFEYDESLPFDARQKLENKAVQAIIAKAPLPEGIRLSGCILHGRKV